MTKRLPDAKTLLENCKLEKTVLGIPAIEEFKHWTSTGSLLLDLSITRNHKHMGIPCKKLTEIVGFWQHGKSALLGTILGNNQKNGGVSILWDVETGFIKDHATTLGIDTDRIGFINTRCMEEGLSEIRKIAKGIREQNTDVPIVVGWDSLPATQTFDMLRRGYRSGQSAEKAAACAEYFPTLAAHIEQYELTFIFTNQYRSNVRGEGDYATGGRAVAYYKQLSIGINKLSDVEGTDKSVTNSEGTPVSGILCKTEIQKNRLAAPFGKAQLYIDFEKGIFDSPLWFYHLKDCGFAEQAGAWLRVPTPDGKTVAINGWNDYLEKMKDKKFHDMMRECVFNSYKQGFIAVPKPEDMEAALTDAVPEIPAVKE